MHFEDTPEEAAFRAEVRAWLEKNAEPKKPGEDADRSMGEGTRDHVKDAKAWQKKKADAGWACLRWPKEYGGREATPIQQVIWNQEEAKFKVPPDIFGIHLRFCSSVPCVRIVGPHMPMPIANTSGGTLKFDSSWFQITCWIAVASRPPYSFGQRRHAHPASAFFFCQAFASFT